MPNYSAVSAPLTELTRKRAPNKLIWEARHQQAFDKLRHLLSAKQILRSRDLERPFMLRTDASSTSLGAVLLQRHDGVLPPPGLICETEATTKRSTLLHNRKGRPRPRLGHTKVSCLFLWQTLFITNRSRTTFLHQFCQACEQQGASLEFVNHGI